MIEMWNTTLRVSVSKNLVSIEKIPAELSFVIATWNTYQIYLKYLKLFSMQCSAGWSDLQNLLTLGHLVRIFLKLAWCWKFISAATSEVDSNTIRDPIKATNTIDFIVNIIWSCTLSIVFKMSRYFVRLRQETHKIWKTFCDPAWLYMCDTRLLIWN